MSMLTEAGEQFLSGLVESAAESKVHHLERALQGSAGGQVPEGCRHHDGIFLDGFLHGIASALAVLTDCNGDDIARKATAAARGAT